MYTEILKLPQKVAGIREIHEFLYPKKRLGAPASMDRAVKLKDRPRRPLITHSGTAVIFRSG
jgi:hypothetical protein